ncbi:MAG TPA: peptidoglycan DD-metalloendopeptidase family protein [Dermatophilaceae bacterium]|nr:peptidoglycan DD-metalloendopeptidase family protein [Dermatophilaceae bacterium]
MTDPRWGTARSGSPRTSHRRCAGVAIGMTIALIAGPVPADAATRSAAAEAVPLAGSRGGVLRTDPDERRARLQRAIDSSEATLAGLSEDARRAVRALRATEKASAEAQRAVQMAQARVAQAAAVTRDLNARLVTARIEEAQADAELTRIRVDIDEGEGRRNDIARLAYEGGLQGSLTVFLAGGSAAEISERMYLLEKVNDVQNAELDRLALARGQAQAMLARLAEARRRVAALTVQAQANLAEAARAGEQQAAARQRLVALAATRRQQAAAVSARRATEARRLNALQAESERLTALLRARSRQTRGVSRQWVRGSGRFSHPVTGSVTSPFGMRFHPILKYSRLHTGMDFGAGCGTPVYAVGDGEVVRAGWAGGYGNQVVIAHGGSVASTYNHLSAIAKRSGSVGRGSLIGYVGTTGLSTGCHLHFEVRVNGVPVNPASYL